MPGFSDLLVELDRRWGTPSPTRTPIRIIGSAALMLRTNYERGTKDGDVLETAELPPGTAERLKVLAGRESELATRHRVYLDLVPAGFPFLPQVPRWHPLAELNGTLAHLEVSVLDVVDVVVSKLKRFSASDQGDIQAMVDRDLVAHDDLVARFRAAADYYAMDARADELRRYVANLNRVERDVLLVEESVIELPSWV